MFFFDGSQFPRESDSNRPFEKSRVDNAKSPEISKASTKGFPELKVVEIALKTVFRYYESGYTKR